MSEHTYKIIEIVGSSTQGLEQAIDGAVARAAQTVQHLDWFEVTEIRGQLREGDVEHFQVGMKVGFRLEDA